VILSVINREQIQTRAEVTPPTIPRKAIHSLKRMATIFLSPLGFCVIRFLPSGAHFDATYFRENILNGIDCMLPTGSEEDDRRKLVLHSDNAKAHTAGCATAYCREKRMTKALH
jgi:hypothetical protein